MMMLNKLIKRGQRLALESSMPVTSWQRRGASGLPVARQPILKGSYVDSVKTSDLRLSALMVQISRYGSLASFCCCYSHAENTKQNLRFFNR
jgi:hypothetical protein